MKKLYIILALLLITCGLSSCLEVEEHYDFKPDGSASVVYDFDMGKAVSVLMNLMSDSVKSTPEFNMVKDTTLNFYSALPDTTVLKMNADEINMTKATRLHVKMNLNSSIMKVSLRHESKDITDLQYYLSHMSKLSSTGDISTLAKNAKKGNAFNPQQLISGEDYYVYEITPKKFYRLVDLSKFNAFLKRSGSTFAMAKAMLIETPYKLVLNFAKPVKKINNSKAVLSADRKRVTIVTDMNDILKNPSSMNLKIDF